MSTTSVLSPAEISFPNNTDPLVPPGTPSSASAEPVLDDITGPSLSLTFTLAAHRIS